jgi:hypothetical protein
MCAEEGLRLEVLGVDRPAPVVNQNKMRWSETHTRGRMKFKGTFHLNMCGRRAWFRVSRAFLSTRTIRRE